MNNSTKPLFVYFKSPLEYSEPIRRIKGTEMDFIS